MGSKTGSKPLRHRIEFRVGDDTKKDAEVLQRDMGHESLAETFRMLLADRRVLQPWFNERVTRLEHSLAHHIQAQNDVIHSLVDTVETLSANLADLMSQLSVDEEEIVVTEDGTQYRAEDGVVLDREEDRRWRSTSN